MSVSGRLPLAAVGPAGRAVRWSLAKVRARSYSVRTGGVEQAAVAQAHLCRDVFDMRVIWGRWA